MSERSERTMSIVLAHRADAPKPIASPTEGCAN
jgi:hypothetical protein